MYLKRLEIQGFKTFAGRSVFEFRPGITAVVGPNGSGKSNIADAVRWVLGEQSLASLRARRTEELIFSGGARRAPAGLAEVSLTIDNSDRLLPTDFDEVTLTRRATRAGDNEYFVNRARVRLRDIQELTEPLGGSYTIINQGVVDAALTLRPEERRRLFEDAAEIGGFELRRAEAERRLRETDTNLARLSDLLGELEPRLRTLRRQATQARQHRELADELARLLRRHYGALRRAALAAEGAAAARADQLDGALGRARAEQAAAARALAGRREGLAARRQRLGALHQRSGEVHARAEAQQRELAAGEARLSALAQRAEALARSRAELELREREAAAEVAAAGGLVAEAEAGLAGARQALAALEGELAGAEGARQALARQLAAAEQATLRAAQAAAQPRARAEQAAAQLGRLRGDLPRLAAEAEQAAGRVAQARAAHEQAGAELARAELAAEQAAAAELAARAAHEELRARRAELDEQRSAARRALADAEARLDTLSRLARSHAGAFAGVRAAMEWAERTGRPGFALVAAILRTPASLETAIEVALGSRLQNIVVEGWQDAEEAIAELRRSGAGRATFLPLDTLRGGREERVAADGRAVLGVAADLVDFDERYAPVARQLLGRVLVVSDLAVAREQLRRLGGGWSIVTLAGEQVSGGGAVTGGAQTKETGTLRRERELRELPERVTAARAELEQAEAGRRAAEERLAGLARELREREAAAREAARQRDGRRAALDGAARQLARAEQEQAWQAEGRQRAGAEITALEARGAALAGEIAAAEAAAAEARAALEGLRARQEAEAAAGREAQERLAALRGAVAAAEAQLKAQRALAAAHGQALARARASLGSAEGDAAALAAEREALIDARDAAAAGHAALLAEVDALRAQIDPAEAELRADEARLAELERAEQAATAALLSHEAAAGQARLEAQRATDRREAVEERAAAEGVAADGPDDDGPAPDDLAQAIEQLRARILRLGAVNPLALEEFEEAAERQRFLSTQIDDLRRAGATLRELIDELHEAMGARFRATFSAVAGEFERRFARLFGGGAASLQLVSGGDPEAGGDPRAAGVEITARPPGKRPQPIALLSGGERALTAAALLFAILTVNPSPFCILDEVDAALDESNVGRFREALADLTATTQFIVVTHNRGTIEAADSLYGVTMGDDGASKVFSLRVEDYATLEEA